MFVYLLLLIMCFTNFVAIIVAFILCCLLDMRKRRTNECVDCGVQTDNYTPLFMISLDNDIQLCNIDSE